MAGKEKGKLLFLSNFPFFSSVGLPGFEPGMTGPESVVLPLHHSPNLLSLSVLRLQRYEHFYSLQIFWRINFKKTFRRGGFTRFSTRKQEKSRSQRRLQHCFTFASPSLQHCYFSDSTAEARPPCGKPRQSRHHTPSGGRTTYIT